MQNRFFYSISSVCVALFVPFGGAWAQSNLSASACEYLVRPGDSLSLIAQRELGTVRRWQEIRDMNPDKVGEDGLIAVGEYLNLPCEYVLISSDDESTPSESEATETAESVETETTETAVVEAKSEESTTEASQLVYPDMVWEAAAGSRLSRVLARWANNAGYHLVIRSKNDWAFEVPFAYEGDFRTALEVVVTGFSLTHVTPSITIYTNKVIVLD